MTPTRAAITPAIRRAIVSDLAAALIAALRKQHEPRTGERVGQGHEVLDRIVGGGPAVVVSVGRRA